MGAAASASNLRWANPAAASLTGRVCSLGGLLLLSAHARRPPLPPSGSGPGHQLGRAGQRKDLHPGGALGN